MRNEFKYNKACEDIVAKVSEYLTSSEQDDNKLEEKYDLLLEFALYYPHAIQKNKNVSPGIDSLWKDKKMLDERGEKEVKAI